MKIIYALILAVMTLLNGCQRVVDSEKNTDDLGYIELYNGAELDCTYSVQSNARVYVEFDDDDDEGGSDCGENVATAFELKGVAAGVKISFCDLDECETNNDNDWRYTIQTLKRESKAKFQFDQFIDLSEGDIPNPAFRIYRAEFRGGSVAKDVSAMIIDRCDSSSTCKEVCAGGNQNNCEVPKPW